MSFDVVVKRALTLGVLRLPPAALHALSGGRRVLDGNELDAQVQLLLWLSSKRGAAKAHQVSLAQARENFLSEVKIVDVEPHRLVYAQDRSIAGPGGAIAVRVSVVCAELSGVTECDRGDGGV